ncbi:MAG: hypothetical protein RMM17_09690 [Acidobacteriota bacterium]|nr:hypothetical protein [Blastocatellia bacterium]MDW8412940.1 hypothetical protein [Acidobacteriota bacterium]
MLTEDMQRIVNKLQEAVEQALDVALTDEQRATFSEAVAAEVAANERAKDELAAAVQMFAQMSEQIAKLVPAKRKLALREFGRQLYCYAEQSGQGNPVAQMIIDAYKAKNELLVDSSPPLSRQAAESYAEMNHFLHAVITRSSPLLDKARKEQLVETLKAEFTNYPLALREQISQADALWGVLRYNYAQASHDEREQFRKELIEQLRQGQSGVADTQAADPQSLAANSKFQQAVQKLRLSARQGMPKKLW